MSYLNNKYPRSHINPDDRKVAFTHQELVQSISNASGYSKSNVEDILHTLAAVAGIKLKQGIPVMLEGLGLFKVKPARVWERYCPIKGTPDIVYNARSINFKMDKYLRDAINTDEDNYRVDFSKIDEKELAEKLKEHYNAVYGVKFEKLGQDKFGSLDDLDSALKSLG